MKKNRLKSIKNENSLFGELESNQKKINLVDNLSLNLGDMIFVFGLMFLSSIIAVLGVWKAIELILLLFL